MIAVRDPSVADRENRLPALSPRSRLSLRSRPRALERAKQALHDFDVKLIRKIKGN